MITNYKKISLFPTEVLIFKTKLDVEVLAKHVRNFKDQIDPKGIQRSNVGGWHSITDYIERAKEFKEFLDVQHECLETAMRDYNLVQYSLVNSWANISIGKDINRSHIHPNSFWSCCMYIKVPGGGIEFEDPRLVCQMEGRAALSKKDYAVYQITPEEGDLIIFPSWLRHRTLPSYSRKERITIASNYSLRGL